MLSGIFVMGGCGLFRSDPERPPRPPVYITSECGAWVYRKYDRMVRRGQEWVGDNPITNNDGERGVALVSVVDEYLYRVVDERNFLVIPTEIDGNMVVQLGDLPRIGGGPLSPQSRNFHEGGGRVDRIVIPNGIIVEGTFWNRLYTTNYVEFLAEIPQRGVSSAGWFNTEGMTLIVPDGSYERYRETWRSITILERSEIYNNKQQNKGDQNK